MAPDASVVVVQRRSANGANRRQRETLRSLGLGRIGRSVEHRDNPALRGMVKTVAHLVTIEDQANAKRARESEG
jgi:large subunit ribosomal protein L30